MGPASPSNYRQPLPPTEEDMRKPASTSELEELDDRRYAEAELGLPTSQPPTLALDQAFFAKLEEHREPVNQQQTQTSSSPPARPTSGPHDHYLARARHDRQYDFGYIRRRETEIQRSQPTARIPLQKENDEDQMITKHLFRKVDEEKRRKGIAEEVARASREDKKTASGRNDDEVEDEL